MSRYGHLDVVDGMLVCHECEGTYRHLATHARRAHGLTAAQYRERHGLGVTTSLVAPDVAAGMSERSRQPERLAHLAAVRDEERLQAHRGRQSWRPEVVRKAVERGEATRRGVPAAMVAELPPWEELLAWTREAHRIIEAGYSVTALARAVDRPAATVAQRLRRHPAPPE